MDETVNMKRSVFNYMREKQYYDYMKADNTYHILLKDTDSINFDVALGHNFIDQFIDPIGKEHIKKALCKVVFISVPKEALDDGNSRGIGFLKCNLARNTLVGGGRGTGYLGGFNMDEVTEIVDVTVPAITTDAAIINQGNAPALEDAANSNTGAYNSYNSNTPLGILPANSAALPRVSQASYITGTPQATGVRASMFSTPEVLIDNPFGKQIKIDAMESNFQSNIDMGTQAGEEFSIMLEIQLLPNFQENDRLNY
tara:strand:- start:51 stop:818 length:768 start_codon:yes stop_codon:yes gene_type:complete